MQLYIDDESQKLSYFYHFTTFDAFKSIVSNFCLYMTQINENLNDKNEQLYVKGIGEYYITCFSAELNEALWDHSDYGKGKEQAVCIGIKNTKLDKLKFRYENETIIENHHRNRNYSDKNSFYDFGLFGLSIHKVLYKNNPMDDYSFDENLYNFFENCCNVDKEKLKEDCIKIKNRGYVKSCVDYLGYKQTIEKEHRMIAIMVYKGIKIDEPKPYNYIKKILMDFSALKNDIILFIKNEFVYKEEFVKICEKYDIDYSIIE